MTSLTADDKYGKKCCKTQLKYLEDVKIRRKKAASNKKRVEVPWKNTFGSFLFYCPKCSCSNLFSVSWIGWVIYMCICIDSLHIMAMQPIWRTKQDIFSSGNWDLFSCKTFLLFCPPDCCIPTDACKGSVAECKFFGAIKGNKEETNKCYLFDCFCKFYSTINERVSESVPWRLVRFP